MVNEIIETGIFATIINCLIVNNSSKCLLINIITFTALSKLISLPLLHVVVNMVGKKWERLGIRLGVPDFVLEQIDHVCSNLPDKALATINKWYELAPQEATVKNLADCLEYIGRKDIADMIRTIKWSVNICDILLSFILRRQSI